MGGHLAIIAKQRPQPDMAEVLEMVGDVRGKTAVIVDDMISTGGTLIEAAEMLLERGAAEVYACATHGIFAGDAIDLIQESRIKEVITTNTIPQSNGRLAEQGAPHQRRPPPGGGHPADPQARIGERALHLARGAPWRS